MDLILLAGLHVKSNKPVSVELKIVFYPVPSAKKSATEVLASDRSIRIRRNFPPPGGDPGIISPELLIPAARDLRPGIPKGGKFDPSERLLRLFSGKSDSTKTVVVTAGNSDRNDFLRNSRRALRDWIKRISKSDTPTSGLKPRKWEQTDGKSVFPESGGT